MEARFDFVIVGILLLTLKLLNGAVGMLFDILIFFNELDALRFSVTFGLAQLLHAELYDLVFGLILELHVCLILVSAVFNLAIARLEEILELGK